MSGPRLRDPYERAMANGSAILGTQGARIDVIGAGAAEVRIELDNGEVLIVTPASFGHSWGLRVERRRRDVR